MSDHGDFTGNLQLDFQRPQPAVAARPGGLRGTGFRLSYQEPEEEKAWTVETEPPPEIVTLISLWEFCRMLILMPVFAVLLVHPHTQWTSPYFWRIYFVVSNGGLSVSWMTAVSFVYALVIGVSIWNPVFWARWTLFGTSLYSAGYLVRFLLLFSSTASSLGSVSAAGLDFLRNASYAMIGLNLVIAIGLVVTPGVAEAFRRKS